MSEHSDVVVIGAGHNALIAAAYLARAGLAVTVLEEQDQPGGGTATRELTLPGYLEDIASTFHMYAQLNPAVGGDELGLAEFGLRYVAPNPTMVSCFDPADPLVVDRSAEVTADAIGRYSKTDAQAFLDMLTEYEPLLTERVRRSAAAPGAAGPPPDPAAAAKLDALSALDGESVVVQRFSDDRTRAMLLGFATVIGDLSRPGTGAAPAEFALLLSRLSSPVPVGGSEALPKALVACVEAHGGRVLCGQPVTRISVENGRATAVISADGVRFAAGRAVVSGAHVTQLADLIGADHPLPPEFGALAGWRNGGSVFQIHLALNQAPTIPAGGGAVNAVNATFGTPRGVVTQWGDITAGRLPGPGRLMVALAPSVIDPSRVPAGHASMRLFTHAPYALNGSPANWAGERDRYAEELITAYARSVDGYEPGDELGRAVLTPVDLHAGNRHFVQGGYMGGEMIIDQLGVYRPVKGWSGYRMPIPALYQTGACTHTGGGVSGWPGRNTANVVLDDLGIDTTELMRAPEDIRLPVTH
jgi:phytoene dehydrogenase-like protein